MNNGHMTTGLDNMATCNIKDSFFPLYTLSYVWNFTKEIKYPERYLRNGTFQRLTISYRKSDITHISLPELGLFFRDITECTSRIKYCFG